MQAFSQKSYNVTQKINVEDDKSSTFVCYRSVTTESRKSLDEVLVADALVVDNAADGLGKHVGNGELLDLGTALGVGDGVGEHNLLEG